MNDGPIQAASGRTKMISPAAMVAFLQAKLPQTQATGSVIALLMLDLRRSDRLSALVGDSRSQDLFQKILDRVDGLLKPDDRFAAVSHDEVWLALPNLSHRQLAVLAATRILGELDAWSSPDARRFRIHPCVGIACFPEHAADLGQLLDAADLARHSAASSEDRYSVFQASQAGVLRDAQFDAELKKAIVANELELHYQPQVDLQSGECRSAEALIRWHRADGRPVSAAVIAEAAEHGETLHLFTVFVLNTALRHLIGFGRGGPQVRLSVNLSAKLVCDDELPGLVGQLLDAWGVPPAQITIEVTESSIVSDVVRSAEILGRLKSLGVRLAMDDFGTGYSSLAHLKLFPFDEIKIDQLFVKNMLQSTGDLQIVRAMVDLGHNFGMTVVAEGVEDLPTLRRLKVLNCDLAQGYVVGKPMAAQTFGEWLGSRPNFSFDL